MILDAETGARAALAERVFDVCVVGSGPAGMALSMALDAAGKSVALMEGGGRELTFESQELYDGEVVGADYYPLTATRLRFFGGSSNHWGGWVLTLDEHDFQPRVHHPLSGWPIAKADLDPYAAATEAFLLVVGSTQPAPSVFGADAGVFEPFRLRFSRDKLLAKRFTHELEQSTHIHLYLNANLVDIELDEARRTVEHLVFRGLERPEPFHVRARAYVLCLGGLENPRALLNANRQIAAGIGNQNDLVGRFFAEHPHQTVGEIVLAGPLRRREFYQPRPAFIAEAGILNFGLRLEPDVLERSFLTETLRSATCIAPFMQRLVSAVTGRRARCDEGGLGVYYEQWSDPAILLSAKLDIAMEQALNFDSRVRLGQATDSFGLRRIELDWRLGELDHHTIITATTEFGRLLAERDVGRLQIADWLREPNPTFPGLDRAEVGGHHHMCATRMSDDPRTGVVDRHCRVHGIANLYLGGSSVFSTTGHANPTYTIVQLALRLADHLQART
jgi:choline dehydrogenase-like flavoprotein